MECPSSPLHVLTLDSEGPAPEEGQTALRGGFLSPPTEGHTGQVTTAWGAQALPAAPRFFLTYLNPHMYLYEFRHENICRLAFSARGDAEKFLLIGTRPSF